MNIIEQIDDKFRAKFASDYCEVVLTNGEWQQIKEAFEKVRQDALEEAAMAVKNSVTNTGTHKLYNHALAVAIRALKDVE